MFELVNGKSTCPTFLHAVYEYQAFAASWGGSVAVAATMLPAIAGVILGIAAVAKELDQRTAVLAWSVNSSRRHWLLQRVIPLLAVIVVLGLGSPLLFTAMLRLTKSGTGSDRTTDLRVDRQSRLRPDGIRDLSVRDHHRHRRDAGPPAAEPPRGRRIRPVCRSADPAGQRSADVGR